MAVAYINSRAIQNRLDDAVGVFNWKNTFEPWHGDAQICGLSVYDAERGEWVTKYDGAENTDIEPVKGGLSDSFKRAACVWGIGRYLYELGGIWVEVEQRGRSSVIKDSQFQKLEAEYSRAVAGMFGAVEGQGKAPASAAPAPAPVPAAPAERKAAPVAPAKRETASASANNGQAAASPVSEYWVQSIKSGGKESRLLELINAEGEVVAAYVRKSDDGIKIGSKLTGVDLVQKQSSYGRYNLINGYRLAA
jgi:hypothetical protein